jgi:hypothetical protein
MHKNAANKMLISMILHGLNNDVFINENEKEPLFFVLSVRRYTLLPSTHYNFAFRVFIFYMRQCNAINYTRNKMFQLAALRVLRFLSLSLSES